MDTRESINQFVSEVEGGKAVHLEGQASPAVLRQLPAIEGLKTLDLSACDLVNNEAAEILPRLTTVEELYLDGVAGDSKLLEAVCNMKSLDYLSARDSRGIPLDFACFAQLPRLEWLVLDFSSGGLENCDLVGSMDRLKVLGLSGVGATDEELAACAKATALERLYADDNAISDTSLVTLRSLKSLEWVSLNRTKVTDKAIDSLAQASMIQCVEVGETGVTAKGIGRLLQLPSVKRVVARGLAINDADLEAWMVNHGIESIDLSDTKITDVAMETIAKWSSLRVLEINGCHVTNESLQSLSALPELRELSVERTLVTADAARQKLPSVRVTGAR